MDVWKRDSRSNSSSRHHPGFRFGAWNRGGDGLASSVDAFGSFIGFVFVHSILFQNPSHQVEERLISSAGPLLVTHFLTLINCLAISPFEHFATQIRFKLGLPNRPLLLIRVVADDS